MSSDMMNFKVGLNIINNLDGEPIITGIYGKEIAFDCYQCDVSRFNRKDLRKFFGETRSFVRDWFKADSVRMHVLCRQ